MVANVFLQNGYMHNEHLLLAVHQGLVSRFSSLEKI